MMRLLAHSQATASWWLAAPLSLLLLAGCNREDRSAEGTVRLLQRGLEAGDTEEIFKLLSPRARKQLEKLAQLAVAQTGGRRRIRPHELLVQSMDHLPALVPLKLRKIDVNGDRATVTLGPRSDKSSGSPRTAQLTLIRVDGRWRLHLDPSTIPPLDLAGGPASQPASRPPPAPATPR